MNPPICPYCDADAILIDSVIVYGRSFGPIWLCSNWPDCDAYVAVHNGTETPLGTLANAELREWRKRAHKAFDPLWQRDGMSRRMAYQWMQNLLGLPREKAHIAMLNLEECQKLCQEADGFWTTRPITAR